MRYMPRWFQMASEHDAFKWTWIKQNKSVRSCSYSHRFIWHTYLSEWSVELFREREREMERVHLVFIRQDDIQSSVRSGLKPSTITSFDAVMYSSIDDNKRWAYQRCDEITAAERDMSVNQSNQWCWPTRVWSSSCVLHMSLSNKKDA
jgi:hypothetical protein